MSYALEIRKRAVKAYKAGNKTQEEICQLFTISQSSLKRWLRKDRQGQDLTANNSGGRPPKISCEGLETLRKLVIANNSITLAELSEKYYETHKIFAGRSVISRALKSLNLRYKKLSIKSSEKDEDKVKKKDTII